MKDKHTAYAAERLSDANTDEVPMNRIVVRLPGWTKSAARVMSTILDGLLFAAVLFTTYLVFAAQGG